MNAEQFFQHHQINDNPFDAEEARHDPIFDLLINSPAGHPDFAKVLGNVALPSTAVLFGEKGSGKTAIRLLIGRRISEHNDAIGGSDSNAKRTMMVAYDDLNPVLDRFMKNIHKVREGETPSDAKLTKLLEKLRLADHQDAILSLTVTQLVDNLLGEVPTSAAAGSTANERVMSFGGRERKLHKSLPRRARVNLAVLAALYDQPADGNTTDRWGRLKRRLRLGLQLPIPWSQLGAMVAAVATLGLLIARFAVDAKPIWLDPAMGLCAAAAIGLGILWLYQSASFWWLTRKIRADMPTIGRTRGELQRMLKSLKASDRAHQPWPIAVAGSDSRYDLTRRLLAALEGLGYCGVIVLVDRVDEPTLIQGKAERMKSVIWPMMDNKFLQQKGMGLKLLLPLELRYLLHRESSDFFQEARLDKQNLIDRLEWSGATLYDLCSARLRACSAIDDASREGGISLTDLFEEDVSRQDLIDALDQMHQPRDAFKFLYAVVQEHCRMVASDEANFRIPRLTLENVRRQQAQRVQEFHQGHSPA